MTQTSPFNMLLFNQRVTTKRKPFFVGLVRGYYSRGDNEIGYVIEADAIPGLMHIYPDKALEPVVVSDPNQLSLGV